MTDKKPQYTAYNKKMVPIQFRIRTETKEELEKASQQTAHSVPHIVRSLLEAWAKARQRQNRATVAQNDTESDSEKKNEDRAVGVVSGSS